MTATRKSIIAAIIIAAVAFVGTTSRSLGETPSKLPVAVVVNINGLEEIDRAIFSPDGQIVATLDIFAHNAKLWEIASGRFLRTLDYEAYFTAVAFSPDGKWIASAHKDGKIKLWEVATGANTATLQTKSKARPDNDVDAVASLWIDAKGELLLSGDDAGLIAVWSIAERKQLHRFNFGKIPDENARPRIVALRLIEDRTKAIAVTEGSVKVLDVNSGKEIAAFDLPNKYPLWGRNEHYTFSADSIAGDDGLIARHLAPDCKIEELLFLSLKDTKNFVPIDRPNCDQAKDSLVEQPAIFTSPSQESVIIARAGIPELKVWDPQSRSVTRTIKWPDAAGAKIIGLAADFKWAMTQEADKVAIREVETGALVRDLAGYAYAAGNVIASKDGRHILLSHDPSPTDPKQKDVALWQADALSPKVAHLAPKEETRILDFAPHVALAGNEKGEIVLFSTETGGELLRFSVAGVKNILRAKLSPDGKLVALVGEDTDDKAIAVLAAADNGTVKLRFGGRDNRNGMMASTGANDESDLVTAVAFSADGANVAVGRWNGTAEVWSTQRAQRIKTLPADKNDADQIWSLAFSIDGRHLIGGSRNSGVFLWDVATGRLRTFDRGNGLAGHVHFASVALSHDGTLVIGGLSHHAVSSGDIGAEHGIKVWNAANGKLQFTLRGHDGGVGALAFSSDDHWIVSASYDGTIRYWNRTSGKCMATFTMTRDGRWMVLTESGLFAGSPDGGDFASVVRGLKSLPVSQFRDQLYRPDLVGELLKGDHERRYSTAAQQLNLEKIWDSISPP